MHVIHVIYVIQVVQVNTVLQLVFVIHEMQIMQVNLAQLWVDCWDILAVVIDNLQYHDLKTDEHKTIHFQTMLISRSN